jgi:lipopolysaccharide transport system ATP-binding protein
MTTPAIHIKNLGKQYHLANSQRYLALRDVIASGFKNIFATNHSDKNVFWALRDISFDVEEGERVGIIGRNGAGKSTLLKIISRVTPPTTGKASIKGVVSSLLEIGTGFHPELSGRENIFLNGSILGLKKRDIEKQLDSIIQFSGIETFMDMPLKHFSTGMQLRLAFSVAAHLEPDILLIDEVLAVGDLEFQKKCIAKMEEVSNQQGRTILFVSHQLNSISKLCTRGIWLDKGKLMFAGPVDEAIEKYAASSRSTSAEIKFNRPSSDKNVFFRSVELQDSSIGIGEDLYVMIQVENKYEGRPLSININIKDEFGELVSHIINEDAGFSTDKIKNGMINVVLKELNILPGRYYLSLWAGMDMMHTLDQVESAVGFEITEQNNYTSRIVPFPQHSRIIIRSEWQTE